MTPWDYTPSYDYLVNTDKILITRGLEGGGGSLEINLEFLSPWVWDKKHVVRVHYLGKSQEWTWRAGKQVTKHIRDVVHLVWWLRNDLSFPVSCCGDNSRWLGKKTKISGTHSGVSQWVFASGLKCSPTDCVLVQSSDGNLFPSYSSSQATWMWNTFSDTRLCIYLFGRRATIDRYNLVQLAAAVSVSNHLCIQLVADARGGPILRKSIFVILGEHGA